MQQVAIEAPQVIERGAVRRARHHRARPGLGDRDLAFDAGVVPVDAVGRRGRAPRGQRPRRVQDVADAAAQSTVDRRDGRVEQLA